MLASADGCKNGWVVATVESWPPTSVPNLYFCETFDDVVKSTAESNVLVVDMPIGLPSGNVTRRCDVIAKEEMGTLGRDRVFLAPPRETLSATSPPEFQQIHRALTGKGAGLPVWGIVPKLIEVHKKMVPELQDRIREFHPELTWKRIAGEVLPSKHTAAGVLRRIHELQPFIDFRRLSQYKAAELSSIDDVLDAVAGLVTAQLILNGGVVVVPSIPQFDNTGLRMEISY